MSDSANLRPHGTTVVARVSAFGVVVPIRASDDLREPVLDAWRDALTDDEPTTDPVDADGLDVASVLHHLSPAVTTRAIDAMAGELVMLHAAALADPISGRTAVLVAASGTGKTTASVTLGETFAYLTDETAAITRDGVVMPYRKPLSIIDGSHVKKQIAPSALGLRSTELVGRLAALLVIERDPDHEGTPVVELLDTVDAIAAIAPQSSYLPSMDKPLHRLAELIHLVGGAHHVTYAESADLEPLLARLLAAAP
ncbi:hypothetical protein [Nocardioides sp. zg-1230]|uniref:hypothetical protein n=1 Tax=Nocardioides sp. zg-1230 TaxID=2736601 RepID=UPI001554D7A7|nr:hypothetical protein [Nocardioides sp. zg-1230]NPC41224.1 hypothetical protein [Nocardioides sp. zg-1230]